MSLKISKSMRVSCSARMVGGVRRRRSAGEEKSARGGMWEGMCASEAALALRASVCNNLVLDSGNGGKSREKGVEERVVGRGRSNVEDKWTI
jgi:hypothetical protein